MVSKTPDIWLFGLGFAMLAYGAFKSVFSFAIVGFSLLGIGSLARLMSQKGDERSLCSAMRLVAYPVSVTYVYFLGQLVSMFAKPPPWLAFSFYIFYFIVLLAADRVYSVGETRVAVVMAIWKSFRLAAVLTAIFVMAASAASLL